MASDAAETRVGEPVSMPTITSDAEVLIRLLVRLLAIILCNFLSEESSGWERNTPMPGDAYRERANGDIISFSIN